MKTVFSKHALEFQAEYYFASVKWFKKNFTKFHTTIARNHFRETDLSKFRIVVAEVTVSLVGSLILILLISTIYKYTTINDFVAIISLRETIQTYFTPDANKRKWELLKYF